MGKPPVDLGTSGLQLLDVRRMLADAEAARVAGRNREAEMLCRQVMATWPGQPEALHILGLLAHAHGNLDSAIAYLRQACRSPSAPANYFSNLAELFRQDGKLKEGEEAARKATKLNAKMPGGWNNLGIILQQEGKLDESRDCLLRVLALQPNNAEAHNNLANTLKRLGDLAEAEQHWTRALELKPQYPEALSNMMVLLTEQGHYAQAEEYGRRALRLNPRLADAYLNLAGLAATVNKHDAALGLLNSLLKFAPRHVGGLAARAVALRHLDRLDEALDSAKQAVAIDPANIEAQQAMGVVLQATGSVDEALAAYDRAAEAPGSLPEKALVSRGRLFMEHGRMAEAQDAIEGLLQRFPESAAGWYNFSELVKFAAGDAAIGKMEALLSPEAGTSRPQQMLLHFSLGKAFLDTGESAKAFAHLNEGNRMKRETLSYDSAVNCRWIDSIAQVFTPELMAKFSGSGPKSELPIFVLGMPRSGTTLVEQILASHSDVYGAGELKHLNRIANSRGDYPDAIPGLQRETVAQMGNAYLAQVEPLAGGRHRVVDKMPSNFMFAGLIRLILPGARIIHCRRDPVDTCLSCYSKLFADEQSFTYDFAELGAFHLAYQRLMAHWRTVMPPSHFIEVDYEAMVDDTEGQARRLLNFLGLPWEEACLEFYRTERPVRTASVNQVRKPVYRSSSGRWRKHADSLGPLLAALGVTVEPLPRPDQKSKTRSERPKPRKSKARTSANLQN